VTGLRLAHPAVRAQAASLTCALLWVAMLLLGGRGDTDHLITPIVQTLALLAMAFVLLGGLPSRQAGNGRLTAMVVVMVALPVLQLIPLPAALWQALPQWQKLMPLLSTAGVADGWRPLSLDPQLTIEAGLELLPALAGLMLGWWSSPALRRRLILATVGLALLSAVLGGLQRLGLEVALAHGPAAQEAPGLFINRNHQALFLLMALPLAGWLAGYQAVGLSRPRWLRIWLLCGIGAILLIAVLATGSRAGLLLAPLALLATAQLAAPAGWGWRWLVPSAGALMAVMMVLAQNQIAFRPVERLVDHQEDNRGMIRDGSVALAQQAWPLGSGMGSFVRTWPAVEPIDQIGIAYVNHAHNDYLELLAEGGALALGAAGLCGFIMVAAWRRGPKAVGGADVRLRLAALTCLGLVALHSLVDFPLRMMSLAAFAGLLLGFVLRPTQEDEQSAGKLRPFRPMPIIALLAGMALLWPVWGLALSRQALADRAPARAAALWPWSSNALTASGFAALAAGQTSKALVAAHDASRAAPLNTSAYALLVAALEAKGESARGGGVVRETAILGRREPRLEYRRMMQAVDAGDYSAATGQVDILLRQDSFVSETTDFARSLATDPVGVAALTRALAKNPAWRGPFMTSLSGLRAEDVAGHADLLMRLRATKAPPTPDEVNALITRQIALKLFDQVAALARDEGRMLRGTLLPESAGQTGADASSFGWEVRTGTGGDVWSEPGPPAALTRFELRASGTMIGPVLLRRIMMPLGTAKLIWSGREETAGAAGAIRWSIKCDGRDSTLARGGSVLRPKPNGMVEGEAAFAIPPDCPLQTLKASVAWQTGRQFGLVIDRIELR
jgi:hypothetical protein